MYRHLGEYDKVCDDECKRQWEELPQREKDGYGYEHDLMVLLERLVQESDRRIQRGTERIEKEIRDREQAVSELQSRMDSQNDDKVRQFYCFPPRQSSDLLFRPRR